MNSTRVVLEVLLPVHPLTAVALVLLIWAPADLLHSQVPFAITTADVSTTTDQVVLEGTKPVEITRVAVFGEGRECCIFDEVRFPTPTSWITDPIPLRPGSNGLTAVGFASDGELLGSDSIDVLLTEDHPGNDGPDFQRGDANGDGLINISDPISTLGYLFQGVHALKCEKSADSNDDGRVEISDALYTFTFLFNSGQAIPPPTDECGDDPTADPLSCAVFPPCSAV